MLRQLFYWWLGLGILFANKIRYRITGYHRPREFSIDDTNRAVKYDHEIVEGWEKTLAEKGFGSDPFAGKRILELGPGADLGVGLILVAKGADSYTAYDKNPLADRAPKELHNAVIDSINNAGARARAAEALSAYELKQPTALNFKQDDSFSLKWVPDESVDLVVSNAAFEHFERVPEILTQVARALAPGGAFVAKVDLQTHTRVLRDRDPLNVYRYPRLLYRLAKFSGIPNRVRPAVYEKTLKDLGLTLVEIIPDGVMDEQQLRRDKPYMRRRFRKDPTLGYLSFTVIGKK